MLVIEMMHSSEDGHQKSDSPEPPAVPAAGVGKSLNLLNPNPWASRRQSHTSETARKLKHSAMNYWSKLRIEIGCTPSSTTLTPNLLQSPKTLVAET